MQSPQPTIHQRLSSYFLANHRLTILLLIFFIALGLGTTILLRTTGFPEPEIKVIFVRTLYPGATAESVAADITTPLEGAIKDIPEIDTYSSWSNPSLSVLSLRLHESASTETVRSKVASALDSITLPDTAEQPQMTIPEISGPDMILAVASTDHQAIYQQYKQLQADLNELSATASITPMVDIEQRLVVRIDQTKLMASGLTISEITRQLQSLGEQLPVVSDVELDGQQYAISMSFPDVTIDTVRQLPLQPDLVLQQVATVSLEYSFTDDDSLIALKQRGQALVLPAVILHIRTIAEASLSDYQQAVNDILAKYTAAVIVEPTAEAGEGNLFIVKEFSSNTQNAQQVDEVIGGLIGTPLDIAGPAKHLGWILGGIQLVFLVMLAFVSWRAAIIAALAIPLSLVFSNIYLYIIGEDLNTLALFSLVLVIGLVVDPALVLLESIQRKIDIGLRGISAAQAAVKDVGVGLFLAALTNVIVFAPFAVVSGLLGAVFVYIPITIIPAIVGSYIVPLIFLAWFGSIVLRPKKHATQNETENLWGLARGLIRLNTKILASSAWQRLAIITVALVVPLLVAGVLFNSGAMKVVQFSVTNDVSTLLLIQEWKPATTATQRQQLRAEVLRRTAAEPEVKHIYPVESVDSYFVNLTDEHDRVQLGSDIAWAIDQRLAELRTDFFDLVIKPSTYGSPEPNYQVSVAVQATDPTALKTAAQAIGLATQRVCLIDGTVTIVDDCTGRRLVTKVDDGYTEKSQPVIDVELQRHALLTNRAIFPEGPISYFVHSALQQQFVINDQSISNALVDGEPVEIYLDKQADDPTTVADIQQLSLPTLTGTTVQLQQLADIQTNIGSTVIRRVNGQTLAVVQARLASGYTDQQHAVAVTNALVEYFPENVQAFSEGSTAENNRSFQELFLALILAVVLSYIVLAVFFNSFTQPLVIIFAVPLSFVGVFPALSLWNRGQFGFLEIIGLIILVGIVENVAIFFIDAARQKIEHEGWDDKRAISWASGVRFRPVILTKLTTTASLIPLALFSEIYRPISLVIIFGLLTSGLASLITTPILFIFFRWLSRHFWAASTGHKIGFWFAWPMYLWWWSRQDI